MEAGTLEGAGYQPSGNRASAGAGRIWRLLRDAAPERSAPVSPAGEAEAPRRDTALKRVFSLGVTEGVSSPGDAALGELEMELALLREENARLKVERHRPADPGRIIDRMRNLRQVPHTAQTDDPVSRSIIECLTLRDGLLEACQEIQQAMQGMQSRIGTLSVAVEAKDRERRAARPVVDVAVGDSDLELARADRIESGFAKSAV